LLRAAGSRPGHFSHSLFLVDARGVHAARPVQNVGEPCSGRMGPICRRIGIRHGARDPPAAESRGPDEVMRRSERRTLSLRRTRRDRRGSDQRALDGGRRACST